MPRINSSFYSTSVYAVFTVPCWIRSTVRRVQQSTEWESWHSNVPSHHGWTVCYSYPRPGYLEVEMWPEVCVAWRKIHKFIFIFIVTISRNLFYNPPPPDPHLGSISYTVLCPIRTLRPTFEKLFTSAKVGHRAWIGHKQFMKSTLVKKPCRYRRCQLPPPLHQ